MDKFKNEENGLSGYTFIDLDDKEGVIQQSSLSSKPAIRLGASADTNPDTSARVHLDQDMAKQLWPIMKKFAEEGEI